MMGLQNTPINEAELAIALDVRRESRKTEKKQFPDRQRESERERETFVAHRVWR